MVEVVKYLSLRLYHEFKDATVHTQFTNTSVTFINKVVTCASVHEAVISLVVMGSNIVQCS